MTDILNWLNSAAFHLFGAPTTWAELFGFVTGLLSVGLVAINRISNFAWGMLNAFFFLVLFYNAHLFADGTLQVMFFTLNLLGWWAWLKAGPNRTALHVERSDRNLSVITVLSFLAIFIIEIPILRHVHDTYVYFDAFILAGSVAAQILLSFKKIENWFLWIAVDIVSIPLYFAKGLDLTAIVYMLFMAFCFVGLREWHKLYKGQKRDVVADEPERELVAA